MAGPKVSRLYSEGKGLGEKWFTRTYWVPSLRLNDGTWKNLDRGRLVKVKTICEMEFVNRRPQ